MKWINRNNLINILNIISICFLTFIILNIILIPILRYISKHNTELLDDYNYFVDMNKVPVEVMQKVYPGYSDEQITGLRQGHTTKLHTYLDITSYPVRNDYYNVGIEGIRYFSKNISDEEMYKKLTNKNNTYILGGSTTFGQGVSDNETWPYFYQKLSGRSVINFGASGYSQDDEIKKLLYLLRKGYRPNRVIFFDGLNSIWYVCSNNYNVYDQFSRFGKTFYTKNHYREDIFNKSSRYTLLNNLPIYILIKHLRGDFNFSIENIKLNKDANIQFFNHNEAFFIAKNNALMFEKHKKHYLEKTVQYYKMNIEFIDNLSKAFGFDYYFFYQPLGILDKDNFFIKNWEKYEKSAGYNMASSIHNYAIKHIKNNYLNMIDISGILLDKNCPKYTDGSHYTKYSNEEIAQKIYDLIK